MIRFLFLLAIVIMTPVYTMAQISSIDEANDLLEEAHLAFEAGEMERAESLYVRVAEGGYGTATIWANAGTAAYRNGDVGHAVLYYTRALKLNPSYERALVSLEFVSPATNQGFGGVSADLMRSIFGRVPTLLWVGIAQVLFLLGCFAIARSIAAPERDRRVHWFAISAWTMIGCLIFAVIASLAHVNRVGVNDAVVITPGAIARSAPSTESVAQLELPAGTIVRLGEESQRGFVRCTLLDGRSGFILIDDLRKI